MKKKIMLILIVLGFVFVTACSTTLTRTITTPAGTFKYEETATTSITASSKEEAAIPSITSILGETE
ncbi:hypothetical protein LCGC14_0749810 [marine sediment metagenome]|uniref:Uncharacterized protein n=1 Tax=marine sediment metagenome TaxID=412755 RepID=A0A0F9Q4C8_9ZZZZ